MTLSDVSAPVDEKREEPAFMRYMRQQKGASDSRRESQGMVSVKIISYDNGLADLSKDVCGLIVHKLVKSSRSIIANQVSHLSN